MHFTNVTEHETNFQHIPRDQFSLKTKVIWFRARKNSVDWVRHNFTRTLHFTSRRAKYFCNNENTFYGHEHKKKLFFSKYNWKMIFGKNNKTTFFGSFEDFTPLILLICNWNICFLLFLTRICVKLHLNNSCIGMYKQYLWLHFEISTNN